MWSSNESPGSSKNAALEAFGNAKALMNEEGLDHEVFISQGLAKKDDGDATGVDAMPLTEDEKRAIAVGLAMALLEEAWDRGGSDAATVDRGTSRAPAHDFATPRAESSRLTWRV